MLGLPLSTVILVLMCCAVGGLATAAALPWAEGDGDRAVPRLLQGQTQRRVYKSAAATYYLFGYVISLAPSKPEEAPVNSTEAKRRCKLMGMSQADSRLDEDVNAAMFLTRAGGTTTNTWIMTPPGRLCAYVNTNELRVDLFCNWQYPYVCVKRAPKCGKTQCCPGASCCARRMCCQAGSTCCPPTARRRYALCVQGKSKCPP